MRPICLHDRDAIEAALRRSVYLNLYSIGDLDDFFWPYTTWYGQETGAGLEAVILVYTGMSVPVLVALADGPNGPMGDLLRSILHLLPRRIYAHLTPELLPIVARDYAVESHGLHYKMALGDTSRLQAFDTSEVVSLSAPDLPTLQRLYRRYPGNSFDPRMIETGQFFGIRRGDDIVSVAGIHVYSRRYRVAALGNITTDPRYRGQGLATLVTARLCLELLQAVDHIGLNVKADNAAALACYSRLGFERIGDYEECMLTLESPPRQRGRRRTNQGMRYSTDEHNLRSVATVKGFK